MTARVFVPRDSAARSVGADEVAERIAAVAAARGIEVDLVRTGSRGMLWLEPLVEVETPQGRVGYGPVEPERVDGLIGEGMLDGTASGLGPVDELDWLRRQQRLTFARVGVVDPRSADDFERHGGMAGLRAALAMGPEAVVEAVVDSGLRGRGGARSSQKHPQRTTLGP